MILVRKTMRGDDSDKPDAVRRLFSTFRRHVSADGGKLDLDAILSVSRMKSYRHLVIVPDEYEYAFRMLYEVPKKVLKNTIISEDIGDAGASGEITLSSSRFGISSWTVEPGIYFLDDVGFVDKSIADSIMEPSDGYIVLAATRIHRKKRIFWLNPDVIYAESGSDYEYQKEIISIGPISKTRLWYQRAIENGDDTMGELMRHVTSTCLRDLDIMR